MQHTYTLEKYKGLKSRHQCPACGYRFEFSRYVDSDGNYIAEHVGRCNRESKCGYHLTPKQYAEQTGVDFLAQSRPTINTHKPKVVEYIKTDVMTATLKAYDQNTFVKYLHNIFPAPIVERLINEYKLGTTKDGSVIFWQVDNQGQVRTGKVMMYNADGHRDKERKPYFIHTQLGIDSDCINQCLFGLHLVGKLPIGVVESEKTAVIMAAQMPDYTWMATGGKTASLLTKLSILKGKKVVCFPDSDAFEEWKQRLSPLGFHISNALESHLSKEEKSNGYDLADFVQKAQSYFETLNDGTVIEMDPAGYPAEWNIKHPNFKTFG